VLKKWWRLSQKTAISLEFNTRKGTHFHLTWTWLGVFIWGAVATWLIFG
jgi:hypothetical protein